MSPDLGSRAISWNVNFYRQDKLTQSVAKITLFALFVKIPGLSLMPIMGILGIFFLPIVYKNFIKTKIPYRLMILVILSIIFGLGLLLFMDERVVQMGDPWQMLQISLWAMSIPILVSIGLWAFQYVPINTGIALLALGILLSSIWSAQKLIWKGDAGYAIVIVTLTLVSKFPRLIRISVSLTLIVISLSTGARILALACFFALVMHLLPVSTLTRIGRAPKRATFIIFVLLALSAYLLTWFIQAGFAGASLQKRTLSQQTQSQSLILGGRTEWSASLQMFSANPFGYGLGTRVNAELETKALEAVASVGGDWRANYFQTSVFTDRTDLHSQLADMWFHFGIIGLILAIYCATILWGGLLGSLYKWPRVNNAISFVIFFALWDLLFSPMANVDRMVFGLILAGVTLSFTAPNQPDTSTEMQQNTKGLLL